MASIAALPQEIIDLIVTAQQLTRTDLTRCLRVNRQWFIAFAPSLWRDILVVDKSARDHFQITMTNNALVRHSATIQTLETTDSSLIDFIARSCPQANNIRSFTLRLTNERFSSTAWHSLPTVATMPGERYETTASCGHAASVAVLLKRNNNLRTLSLDEWCFYQPDGEDAFAQVFSAIPTTHLEQLSLSFLNPPPRPWFKSKDKSHTLRFIRAKSFHRSAESIPTLTEVSITGGDDLPIDISRLEFLTRCIGLQTIRLDRLDPVALAFVRKHIKAKCHKLVGLDWVDTNWDSDEEIAALLRATTMGWKVLRLPLLTSFGRLSLAALGESIETLEVLRMVGCVNLSQGFVERLLCSARRLRRLEGDRDGQREAFTTGLVLFAYDAYKAYLVDKEREKEGRTRKCLDWVLGASMEYFQLQIGSVPRPDVIHRQNLWEFGVRRMELDGELRFDVQRWVYEQFRRMTVLKELVMGVPDVNPGALAEISSHGESGKGSTTKARLSLEENLSMEQNRSFNYCSLEFSLESGLEMLEGLKELRLLDVKATAHRIGVAELDWMHVNWPKLKEIKGLVSAREWAGDVEGGLEVKAAVEEWLAAHPHGIGSSYYSAAVTSDGV